MNREHTRRNDDDGWVAFSADVACRTIFLKYTGNPARTVPIHFYPGWETQLFLLHHGRPRFETMKFFMVGKGAGFQANDEVARNVNLALTGLQNWTNLLPRPVMDDLLNGKFRNPIEGLIGAHFLLRELEPDAKRIDLVLRNLALLLPNSPDVRALEILRAQRLSRPIDPEPLFEPPMLRAGLEAVIAASAEVRGLIPWGSDLDRISSRVFADTPWSSWKWTWQYIVGDSEVLSKIEAGNHDTWKIVLMILLLVVLSVVAYSMISLWKTSKEEITNLLITLFASFILVLCWVILSQGLYLWRRRSKLKLEVSKVTGAGQEEAWVVRSALGRIIDTLRRGGRPDSPTSRANSD